MNREIIVFGGSGFLGSYVADALSEKGNNVTIFDLKISPYLRPDQKMVKGDIRDSAHVLEAVKGKEIVYHFAGLSFCRFMLDFFSPAALIILASHHFGGSNS